jgi:BioD-like phosphotransacetylase family protein
VSPHDSYTVASRINDMTIKTLPGDSLKIARIRELVAGHLDIDRLLAKLK